MCRGVARSPIFVDDLDRLTFLRHLGVVLRDASSTCFAWALMPNHVHLLLRTGTDRLGHVMQRLLTRYAGHFNRRHGRVGHLFQNRFRSILGEEERYFLALVRYIHLNPVEAGIVDSVDHLRHYRWSGHMDIVGKCRFDWADPEFVLSLFGSSQAGAVTRYVEFLSHEPAKKVNVSGFAVDPVDPVAELDLLQQEGGEPRVLGRGEFVGRVIRQVEGRDRRRRALTARMGPADVLKRAAEVTGVTVADIRGNSRRSAVARARALASKWLVEDLGLPGIRAAELLLVSAAVVSRGVRTGRSLESALGVTLGEGE